MKARPLALVCTFALMVSACGGSSSQDDASEPVVTTAVVEVAESVPPADQPAAIDEESLPEQLPLEDAPEAADGKTSVDDEVVAEEETATTDSPESSADAPQPAISMEDAEQFEAFLDTPNGMAFMVEGIQDQWPEVTVEQAECFLESLTPELMLVYSTIGDMGEDVDMSDPMVVEIVGLVEACGVSLATLGL